MRGAPAVRFQAVDKVYRLYGNRKQAAFDQLGLYRLRFWKPAPQWRDFHALRAISLDIGRGERVAIVGRNGAGKTTLLKLVTGNFAPTSGVVEVNGSVQALMQSGLGFFAEFTGIENVRSALLYSGLAGRDLEAAIEEVVDFAELGDFIHQPLKTYSLGMSARLQFAAATAIRPDILIVDEMLGAGDGYFSIKSAARMRKLTGGGCTLLLVSHSAQQVLEFCERAIWLDHGAVRAAGQAREVLDAFERETEASAASAGIAVPEARTSAPADRHEDYASRPFMKHAVVACEPVDPSREAETEERLADGRKVYRWAGRPGLRFAGLRSASQDGAPVETGKCLRIELDCVSDTGGSFDVIYRVSVHDLTGTPVCFSDSPRDLFSGAAGLRRIARVQLDPLLLGGRDYLLSFAVFDSATLEGGDAVRARFDLLSRSLHLRMRQTNDNDPPYLHYPASWQLGPSGVPRAARISGWQ